MDMGTHDYSEAQRTQVRQATEGRLPRPADLGEAYRAAQARDRVPTLAEVMAATDMVLTPEGRLVPERVAVRGERGWLADEDRDSAAAAELAGLVKQMDQMTDDLLTGKQAYSAVRLANQWRKIRAITQGNGGK